MHPLQRFLKKAGRRILAQRLSFLFALAILAVSSWMLIYGVLLLWIKSLSLTWPGVLAVPVLAVLFLCVALPKAWWGLRLPRLVARLLEERHSELQLSLRTALDFLEGRSDSTEEQAKQLYLTQVSERLKTISLKSPRKFPWMRCALVILIASVIFWGSYRDELRVKFYNPTVSIGQTHLDLHEGSITIFEPEYTQIPGRTLPLKPGTFTAFAGARVRFQVQIPESVSAIFLARDGGDRPVPLRITDGNAIHEFVLQDPQTLRFLLSESDSSGRTQPFVFEIKPDEAPEIQLRSYTPEGPIKELDPLLVELEVKDDFGIKELEAVVSVDGSEKRLALKVPPTRRDHFLTRNQWFLSDLDLGDAKSFTLHFEAKDNNPFNGPGIGKSASLSYELESADKKYDEFMALAKQLLDTMTHVLGDNLETNLGPRLDQNELLRAEASGKQISAGLFQSLTLSNDMLGRLRETPNLSQLDQNFLYQFRGNLSNQAQMRVQLNQYFGGLQSGREAVVYSDLLMGHTRESVGVENLTYDLVVQLKLWALFEMERHENQLNEDMKDMEALLDKADEMESEELMKLFNKMMDEVMKDFNKMMEAAAQQMNMDLQEFMNQDALKDSTDQMQELRKAIMEALKKGDTKKAKALMEELKAQMESTAQSMKESMGEMSGEMKAMMADMKELMGLLRELKGGEENLEKLTRDLKAEYDKKLGPNQAKMDESMRLQMEQATARIHQWLETLYNQLVEYKPEDLSDEIMRQINQRKKRLSQPGLTSQERLQLTDEIDNNEQLMDMLTRDGLSALQDETLKSIQQTEQLQEYLDQSELDMAFDSGLKLDGTLDNGRRISQQTVSPKVQEETHPTKVFDDSRKDLQKILQNLLDHKNQQEDGRSEAMRLAKDGRAQDLSQDQAELQKMIQSFLEKTKESFGESQVGDKLNDIHRSMQTAQDGLREELLDAGIRSEQEVLQKIGEMMEQMQQSSQPGGGKPQSMRFGHQQGFQGDPSLEDIYIPESEKKAVRDQLKDNIRERMNRNLPDAYGKEIRKYYEKLMDQ